jgi:hypothetical protein
MGEEMEVPNSLFAPKWRTCMGLIRVQRRCGEQIARQRILSVLISPAARKIDFHLEQIHVVGSEVGRIVGRLLVSQPGQKGIGIRFRHLDPGVGAEYDSHENEFDLPDAGFGLAPEDRSLLFHECVHAWMDARVPKNKGLIGMLSRIFLQATALTEEAAAYVSQSLFELYDSTSGTGLDTDTAQTSPIILEADRIAAGIQNRPGAVVPASSVCTLKQKIMADAVYSDLKANPTFSYDNDGV